MKVWLQNIISVWKFISYQGVPPNKTVGPDEYRIILINRLSLTGSIISFVYIFYYKNFPSEYLYLIEGILVFLYLTCIISNRFRKYRTAKFLIIILALVNVFINASSLSKAGGDHLILIPIFFAIPLIHDKKNVLDIFISGFITLLAYSILEFTDYSLFKLDNLNEIDLHWDYRLNMLLTFILSVVINFYYFQVKDLQHQHLLDAEKKLSNIFDQAYDAIFLVDKLNFSIINCSNKALHLFRVSKKSDLIGNSLFYLFKGNNTAHNLGTIRKILDDGNKWDKEIECLNSNGETFWGNVAISSLNITNENLLQVRITDTSQRKELEIQLLKAKAEAEQASKSKGAFLANMSHEIRTPIHAIISITRLLLQENPSKHQLKHLNILKVSGENLICLINDILDFSKIEAGKITLEKTIFDLKEVIENIYQAFSYKAEEKQIDLNLNFDERITTTFNGDPVRLNQIITNLVSNALKFTEIGSVSINIDLIEEDDDSANIRFAVKDTGIGIPQEKIPEIFKGFTQASSDTTRKYGGTGLGLTIVKNLVELFGSHLVINSIPDTGSEFTFDLTINKGKSSLIKANIFDLANEQKDLKGANILLVEDNEINQLVASKFIKDWNVVLDIANNGEEAIEKVTNKYYDVILMDLQMPVMDGYEATRRINLMNLNGKKKPAIIALTASALFEIKEKVNDAGFKDFLVKPFHPDELYRKIIQSLDNLNNEEIQIADSSTQNTELVKSTEKSLNFEKIRLLFDHDEQQIDSFLNMCIQEIETFKKSYTHSLKERDIVRVKSTSHKVNSFLTFLEADFLLHEIEKSRNLFENSEVKEADLRMAIRKIEDNCDQFIKLVSKTVTHVSNQSIG